MTIADLSSPPRSRLRPQPLGKRILLTPRDRAVFQLLDRYRYLPSNAILAFVGGHATYHRARLTDLFHEGWLNKPRPQWEAINARYRYDTYELGPKASRALSELGAVSSHRIGSGGVFRHEMLVCLVMASLELAARAARIAVLDWKEVLIRAPERTQQAEAPFALPMTFPYQGRAHRGTLHPDGLPFGLKGPGRTFWFVGIEVDRHTEPLHPLELRSRSSSILRKLLQYQHLVRERLFETHYGMANVLVPIITVNDTHKRNMIDLVLTLTEGQGFKWMLFKTIADFATLERSVEPQMDILTVPWQRAGNPPLDLLAELNRA